MKTTIHTIHHLQGEQAYILYWQQYYHCKPRLSSIKAINTNLEILVDEETKLLAFRYDHPDDMQGMVLNEGHWQVHNEERINSEVLSELRTLMVKLTVKIFVN